MSDIDFNHNYYHKFRPAYPRELFMYLAGLASGHERAWDCGSGNGQAAVSLSDYFNLVIATDFNEKQVRKSLKSDSDNVSYLVSRAEKTPILSDSIDLVTVASAVHWFDLQAFYREVSRALKKTGVIAVWTYFLPVALESEKISDIVSDFSINTLNDYWDERANKYSKTYYKTLPFPFSNVISSDEFHISVKWSLECLLGFLSSFSSSKTFKEKNGYDPTLLISDELKSLWKTKYMDFQLRLSLKAGGLPFLWPES